MTGYLKQYPPLMQLATFVGFFIGFLLLYSLFLSTALPAWSGFTLNDIQHGNLSDPKVIAYLKLTQFLYTLIVYFVPPALFAYFWQPYPMQFLGLRNPTSPMQIILALMVMICALPMVAVLSEWNEGWPVGPAARELRQQAEQLTRAMLRMPAITDLLTGLLLVAIIPAIGEELFFRGVFQRLLIQLVRNKWIGVLLTAIIFSAVHADLMGFVPRVVLGFLLGAVYVLSGNLWLSILGHLLNNGMQVVALYLFQHGYIKTDPMQEEHVAWYLGAVSLIVTAGLLWALKKRSPQPAPVPEESGD